MSSNMDTLNKAVQGIPADLVVKNPKPFDDKLKALSDWLKENDCVSPQIPDFKLCYAQTRLRLITTTYQLDDTGDKLYGSQVTINQLSSAISAVVSNAKSTATFTTPGKKR